MYEIECLLKMIEKYNKSYCKEGVFFDGISSEDLEDLKNELLKKLISKRDSFKGVF